jgi:hypothetical protein
LKRKKIYLLLCVSHSFGEHMEQPFVYFWALGDLHFRDMPQWQELHTPRIAQLFADAHAVWQQEGAPAFCVAPGDIVDKGAARHYALAKRELACYLGDIPLYPGIGNHEYQPDGPEDRPHTAEEFSTAWGKPIRYSWMAGDVLCIMLDQPNTYVPEERREDPHVILSPQSLAFLDTALAQHASSPALIFAHCPLHNTVLDRDAERNLDDDSLDPFFFVENSEAVRAILAQYPHAALYISGHTHSGWGSPQLVFPEKLGKHTVTHLNLMSPWYTGRFAGPRRNAARTALEYRPDSPDVIVSFSLHIYAHKALIRARDANSQSWLAQWEVPIG